MSYRIIVIIWLLSCFSSTADARQSPVPIGQWRDQLPYKSVIDLADAGERLYAATSFSIFSVNLTTKEIERLSRTTGLSETGISSIAYDKPNSKLFIAYTNSNIDILHDNDIINIPDIKRDDIVGNKTIYQVYPDGKDYYLATGLGVIVIDGEKYEVKASWLIGNGGDPVRINGFSSDNQYFYAATAEGLKRALRTALNLADFSNWQLLSNTNGLPAGNCRQVVVVDAQVVVLIDNSLYIQSGNDWNLLYTAGRPITSMNVSANSILLCVQKAGDESTVLQLNSYGIILKTWMQPGVIDQPSKALLIEQDAWIADAAGGLTHFTGASFEQYQPDSPPAASSAAMLVYNSVLYATAGEVNENWIGLLNQKGIYFLKDGAWTSINELLYPALDSLPDFISIAIDKTDETIWAGSYGGGLLHVRSDRSVEIFKQNLLLASITDPGSYRVSGLAFDIANNLWMSNYGAVSPLVVRKSDGNFMRFSPPYTLPENALTQILVDNNDNKWIVAVKGGGLLCYDQGASIDNTGDDRWKKLTTGSGNGNLPGQEVLCIAKDKNGFIWVGTENGIGVIQCPEQLFSAQGCDAVWPIAQQGNFAGYLFNGEQVRNIAIDGADRKWVATKKGAWLISSEGEKVIYQFTESNSPLLSNDVKNIAIDGKTGEVYFATAKGICSFRGDATEGAEAQGKLLVFPNPVPPGYGGSIGIRGLTGNALVKITELNGRLVWQERALGGQAVWDGRDYKGRKISTGVYLVLVSADNNSSSPGKEKAAAKIVFIQQ